MTTATDNDRAYFARIGRANALLEDSQPPTSLRESLARTEQLLALSVRMGSVQRVNLASEDGDLDGHLAYLARLHARRGTATPVPLDADNSA